MQLRTTDGHQYGQLLPMFWWTPCSYLLPVFLLGTAKGPSTIMFYNFLITLIIFVIILNFFIIF